MKVKPFKPLVPFVPCSIIAIVIWRVIAEVKLEPLTTKVTVTLVATEVGVMVIVDDVPLDGVAPVIDQAYVGLVTLLVIAVNVTDAGVITPDDDFENDVNPEMSTNGPTGAIGVHVNDALIGLRVD